jgi:hypothetical protein
MGPAPVGIEHNGTLLVCAALATSASASLPSHLGMGLRLGCANLLSAGGPEEGERSDGECPVHSDCRVKVQCWMSKGLIAGRPSYIETSRLSDTIDGTLQKYPYDHIILQRAEDLHPWLAPWLLSPIP